MEIEEFVKDLGIYLDGHWEESKYVIDLVDSDEYSKMYTILDNSEKVDLDEDSTLVTDKVSELLYLSDDYDIKLVANFADDIYKIVIKEGED